jgi:hypothetical protein
VIVIDDWIRQQPHLKLACEALRGKKIMRRCWYDWEVLAGAVGKSQHLKNRIYTDEQARMFLAIAWLRKHFPAMKLTYKAVRQYYEVHAHKIEEAFDRYVAGDVPPPPEEEIKLVPLSQVKKCCDRIFNREISRDCWARWKQHLGIPKYELQVEEGMASLLTFLAVWRSNNPCLKTPSVSRLTFLMTQEVQAHTPIEAMSSASQQYQWKMQGCIGKDLPRFLASQGYRVSVRSLYEWGAYHKRHHYTVSELNNWLNIAREKRNYGSTH